MIQNIFQLRMHFLTRKCIVLSNFIKIGSVTSTFNLKAGCSGSIPVPDNFFSKMPPYQQSFIFAKVQKVDSELINSWFEPIFNINFLTRNWTKGQYFYPKGWKIRNYLNFSRLEGSSPYGRNLAPGAISKISDTFSWYVLLGTVLRI